MSGVLLAVLVLLGGAFALSRRRRPRELDQEPWRASLQDDEPLDIDAIRDAEEEFLADDWEEDDGEEGEEWR